MKVTREVMKDLLPLYFSGEASDDTRTLVEEYFRENPEFERMARGSARSLEMLQTTVAVAPEAKKEKRDLESVHKAVWRHKLNFGLALLFTLVPLAFVYSKGHLVWMMVRNAPWEAGLYWLMAALFWVLYFVRPRRRTASLITAIFFAVIPPVLMHGAKAPADVLWAAIFIWCAAALSLVQFVARWRRRATVLMFAIFTTVFPVPFLLYSALTGGRNIMKGGEPVCVTLAVVMWAQYFWLRRKAKANPNSDEDECY
jgi:hypothetical protein